MSNQNNEVQKEAMNQLRIKTILSGSDSAAILVARMLIMVANKGKPIAEKEALAILKKIDKIT